MLNRIPNAIAFTLTVLAFAPAANAESWICEQGTLVREININRDSAEAAPCQVAYDKQSEGLGSEVLWSANFDGSYCDTRANGLAEKLEGLGWSCSAF